MKIAPKIAKSLEIILILWLATAMYLQQNIGLADNGDFSRAMEWISSGPVEIEPNWPAINTEQWLKRFFKFWIPYWKEDWNVSRIPRTSAFLLWLPGAILNKFLYSQKVLYLPSLAILSKLILFVIVLLIFKLAKLATRHRIIFLFSLGLPAVLLFTCSDYVAYLNTFYQESASFIFVPLLLASIFIVFRYQSLLSLMCSLTFILLTATSKPSNIYWPLIAIPFVTYAYSSNKTIKFRNIASLNLALIILLFFVSAKITEAGSIKANPYHSLFYGVLTFSDRPDDHIKHLGLDSNAIQCIKIPAYSSSDCFTKYQNQVSFFDTIKVIFREPRVILLMYKHLLNNMQDISLEYLGKYSIDDPRSRMYPVVPSGIEERFQITNTEILPLNLWSELKFNFFPTGYALFFTIICFITWFIVELKHNGFRRDLACVGLLSTIACITDMTVAILGDGRYELIKHLFLSNLLFDIAVIMFINSVLIYYLEFHETKLKLVCQRYLQRSA